MPIPFVIDKTVYRLRLFVKVPIESFEWPEIVKMIILKILSL